MEYELFMWIIIGVVTTALVAYCNWNTKIPAERDFDTIYEWWMNKLNQMKEVANDNNRDGE